MPKFIKLPVIHQNNIEGDTTIWVRPDGIAEIIQATQLDSRQRSEIKSLILMKTNNSMVGTSLTPKEVLAAIDEAEM